jgi:soluble lytic murein transglycosylase-like protein
LTRSPRRTHPLAALVAAGVLALAALAGLSPLAAAPASAGPYSNPSPADIRAKLSVAAVAHGIPPKILYGIAYQESTWRQFDASGDPLISPDNGIGIMQVTMFPPGVDVARLKTDIDYNIGVGADILVTKWGYAPSVFAVIGDGNPRCYEDWFFAAWA